MTYHYSFIPEFRIISLINISIFKVTNTRSFLERLHQRLKDELIFAAAVILYFHLYGLTSEMRLAARKAVTLQRRDLGCWVGTLKIEFETLLTSVSVSVYHHCHVL
jgi:hypothetical protein